MRCTGDHTISIGRASKSGNGISRTVGNCVLNTQDRSVSRKHAQISYAAATGRFSLACLGANHVLLNDDTILTAEDEPLALCHNDRIVIGPVTLTFIARRKDRPSGTGGADRGDQAICARQKVSEWLQGGV